MSATLLGAKELAQIIDLIGVDRFMDELIYDLTAALDQYDETHTKVMVRNGFVYPEPNVGVLEWMPVMHADGEILVKLVAYNPLNPDKYLLPTILSTLALFDSQTGRLKVLTDGLFLTAVRTAASSAVASRVLALPDSRIIGLVGAGAQAVTQLHALSRVFKLERALVFDTDAQAAASFAQRVSFIPVQVESVSLETLEAHSDIICTATTVAPGLGPVIKGNQLKVGIHINAVGSDLPGKTELPLALLQKSLVCPDFPEQAKDEGECQQLPADAELGPSLTELIKNRNDFTKFQGESTVFDSTGFALEDLVAVRLLHRHAKALGLGQKIEVEAIPSDPKNPYSFLTSHSLLASN